MDIKVAKFFPLGLAGLLAIKEASQIYLHINYLGHYFFPLTSTGNFIGVIANLFIFACKVIVILAALFIGKLYFDGKPEFAKWIALGILGIFAIRNLVSLVFHADIYENAFFRLTSPLVLMAITANIIVAFLVRSSDTSANKKSNRQQDFYVSPQQQMPQAQFQAPQQFAAPAGQSIPDQLAALQVLVDNGTLTQAEFKAAKQRIIGA